MPRAVINTIEAGGRAKLFKRLIEAGYSLVFLSRVLSIGRSSLRKRLNHPQDLTFSHLITISGLLGIHILTLLEILCSDCDIQTMKSGPGSKGRRHLKLPAGFGTQKGPPLDNLPKPGWYEDQDID